MKVPVFNGECDIEFLNAANASKRELPIVAQVLVQNRSGLIISDDIFSRLLTFSNVIMTGYQAFFAREALAHIATTTIDNLTRSEKEQAFENQVLG
jgi:lactate dehydrogenase-like 2-hydroxyacid dehydrogenase